MQNSDKTKICSKIKQIRLLSTTHGCIFMPVTIYQHANLLRLKPLLKAHVAVEAKVEENCSSQEWVKRGNLMNACGGHSVLHAARGGGNQSVVNLTNRARLILAGLDIPLQQLDHNSLGQIAGRAPLSHRRCVVE